MVDILPLLQAKWGIHILDLWNDDEMNNVGADYGTFSAKKLFKKGS